MSQFVPFDDYGDSV